jgi:hypothetical protein
MAQEIRGTILGQVSDESGLGVPGAKVSIVNEATNVGVEVATNMEGRYVAPFLSPGNYAVKVEKEGFSRIVREKIILQTQDRMNLDFVLKPGTVAESITVTAESPMLQTASADFGQVVSNTFVNRLPVVATTPLGLADMAPGAVPSFPDNTVTSYQSSYVQINGSAGPGNQIAVDGAPVDLPRQNGTTHIIPMAEMVEELKVVTALFDAAHGRTKGGSMFVSTKTGTNNYHGSLYYHLRDERFNANSWTNNYRGVARGTVNYYTAGGIIGGPIRKDRTFFNAGVEYMQSGSTGNFQFRVPSEVERKGDFSRTLNGLTQPLQLYDPLTTVLDSGGRFVSRQLFPDARMPASRLNPTGEAIASQFPLPNYVERPNQLSQVNHLASTPVNTTNLNIQTRVDHVLNSKHRLYGRLARNHGLINKFNQPAGFPGYWTGSGINTDDRLATNIVVEDTMTFGPSLVATLNVSFNRYVQPGSSSGDKLDPAPLKLPAIILDNLYSGRDSGGGWPRIEVLDGNVAYIGPWFRVDVNNVLSVTNTFSKFWGAHSLRWGGEYRNTRWFYDNPGNAQNSLFSFDKHLTRARDDAAANQTSGSGMASLLLGLPTGGSLERNPAMATQSHYGALFIQDDYRITRKLTLSFGLRYEMETPSTERYDRSYYDFVPDANLGISVPGLGPLKGGVRFVNVNGLSRRQGLIDLTNFGPRLSAAYSVNDKTVARAGWALFYQGISNSEGTPSAPPTFTFTTPYQGSSDGYRTVLPGVSLSNPFPNGLQAVTGTSLGYLSQVGTSVSVLKPDRKVPSIQQMQVSVQRQLPWNSVVEVAYVGVRYDDLYQSYNLNDVPDAYRTQDNSTANPFYGILPSTTSRGAGQTITANQLKTAFPQFTSVTQRNTNGPWGRYHAMQSRWEKRMSQGVQFVANYTYSKNLLHDVQSLVNDRFYKSVTDNDRTHIARLFFTADLPFGKQRAWGKSWPGWLDVTAGGWAVTWVTRYSSGAALGLNGPNGRPIPMEDPSTGAGVHDCLGDPVGAMPTSPCLDVTKIAAMNRYDITPEPPRYAWLRGPGYADHDAVMFKTFRLVERLSFELRAEVNNVMNTPRWENPRTDINNRRTFGTINAGGNPRSVRFTARLHF